jgi:hypothetical protein
MEKLRILLMGVAVMARQITLVLRCGKAAFLSSCLRKRGLFESKSALILRSAPQERVSKDEGGPSFETHCHSASKTRVNALMAMLLRMRPSEVA